MFQRLAPGGLFLFKLHHPDNFIVGGGIFAHACLLPLRLAWEAFGEKNGATSLEEMNARVARYRRERGQEGRDHDIGCILLQQPFFFARDSWIPIPREWSRYTVQGKGYEVGDSVGEKLMDDVRARLADSTHFLADPLPISEELARYGQPTLIRQRLGQGTFRALVTDVYSRRCAVTGERTLPVLQAAHIKPYASGGPHAADNGILLRSDLHTLLDLGYVTISPDLRFEVGNRIREEFENGRDYYALKGKSVATPGRPEFRPSRAYLEWHSSSVFKG